MAKPTFKEFEKEWWKNHPDLAKTELAMSGQFDEFPYVEFEEKYGCPAHNVNPNGCKICWENCCADCECECHEC